MANETKNQIQNVSLPEMLMEMKKPNYCDYIDADGNLAQNVQAGSVMVTKESDLLKLTNYAPGSIAYTAGFLEMWQLSADGVTWVSLIDD